MMATRRPFASIAELIQAGDEIWQSLTPDDWLEAFGAHPRIGAGKAEISGHSPASSGWAAAEQLGMQGAADKIRDRLAEANRSYEVRFGYIFIICATGKSAAEMLGALERRLTNAPEEELVIAAEEQRKITTLRLARLID
jgi:OHCU decarboxylase